MKKNKFVSIILISFFNISCIKLPHDIPINPLYPVTGCENATKNPSLSIDTLMSYPEFANISGEMFKLWVTTVIDSKNPLKACTYSKVYLSLNKIGLKIPNGYKFERIWFINTGLNEVWEKSEVETKPDGQMVFYGGPKWGRVEGYAVIKITDTNNNPYFIRTKIENEHTNVD